MQYIEARMAAEVIDQLPRRFDAHRIEKRLMRLHTAAVAHELLRFSDSGDVLRNFSAQLARWVDRIFVNQIRQVGRVESENLAGNVTPNTMWEKLVDKMQVPAHMHGD